MELLKNLKAKNKQRIKFSAWYIYGEKEWDDIKVYIKEFVSGNKTDGEILKTYLSQYPKLTKGGDNVTKLISILNEVSNNSLPSYKVAINTIISTYMTPKPSVLDCYFFPNTANEKILENK